MPVEFLTNGPAIADADIDAFETRIGGTLPVDYRMLLLNYNGGRPKHHVICHSDIGDVSVKLFFGIWDSQYYDIAIENQTMRGRWPARFLSIAIGDCGDRFLLSLAAGDYGNVYFWDHEEEAEEDEEPTEANLYHLGDSFTEFWERIKPIDREAYLAEKGFAFDDNAPEAEGPKESGANGKAP